MKLSTGQKIFAVTLIFLLSCIAYAQYMATITMHVTVVTTEVSLQPSVIDWGTMHINESKSQLINVTNTGTTNVTLTFTLLNAPDTFQLSYNYTGGQILHPAESMIINITLTIQTGTAVGDYDFELGVTAIEV